MIPLLASIFIASVVGSLHCAGMCGPFVGFYAGQAVAGRRWRAHAAYSLGRLASYAALGAAAGALGSGVDHMGALAGVSRAAAVLGGFLMIVWAGATLLNLGGLRTGRPPASPLTAWLGRRLATLSGRPPAVRGLAMGFLTTLLPCGWLYAFVASAGATGSAARGALLMTAFWAGTLPTMLGLGLVLQGALAPMRRRLPAVTASVLMVLGLLTITGKLHAPVSAGAPVCHTHAQP